VEQLIVRDAAPQEERQTRCEFQIVQAVRRVRRRTRGVLLDTEQEVRTHEDPSQPQVDARLEVAGAPPGPVRRRQLLTIRRRQRTAECPTGDRRQDPASTRCLLIRRGRMTNEDPPAAGRIAGSRDAFRTANFDAADAESGVASLKAVGGLRDDRRLWWA